MIALKILIKLFPRSFQEQMGEAWLEASETEIQERQKREGKKLAVTLGFIWETLYTVLPQAHSHTAEFALAAPSVQEFVPEQNETVLKILVWVGNMMLFHVLGMVIALHAVLLSVFPQVVSEWKYSFGGLLLCALLMHKVIYRWWCRRNKPLFSAMLGTLFGYIGGFSLIFLIVAPYEFERTAVSLNQYTEMRSQMGLMDNAEGHKWFAITEQDRVLRPEKKEQWCALARARVETLSSVEGSGSSKLSGFLFASLASVVYQKGCWTDETQYIALQHKIAKNAIRSEIFDDMFSPFEWIGAVHQFKILELGGQEVKKKVLYSPRRYCYDYVQLRHKNPEEVVKGFCQQFEEKKAMSTIQSQTVRAAGDVFTAQQARAKGGL